MINVAIMGYGNIGSGVAYVLSKTLFTLSVDEKMKVTMVAEIPNTTPVNVIKNSLSSKSGALFCGINNEMPTPIRKNKMI